MTSPSSGRFQIRWSLHSAMQGDYEMLVGVAPAIEVDAVSSVPHLPDDIEEKHASKLLAEWALDPKKGEDQWQRRPDPLRIQGIKNFANSSPDNLVVNSIMLYVPPEAEGVEIVREERIVYLEIDMSKFLRIEGPSYTDVTIHQDEDGIESYTDHRPIWIVDGQHRTRGLALSSLGANKNIPLIILHSETNGGVTPSMVAKIFTEINTLSQPLDLEQSRYLGFKHEITSAFKEKTYGPLGSSLDAEELSNRRANKMAYELACRLNIVDDGAFESGVQLVKGIGAAKVSKMQLKMWLKNEKDAVRDWFVNGIYSDHSIDMNQVLQEVGEYFESWSETVNHDDYSWRPGAPRWNPYYGGEVSLLDKPNNVRVLMVRLFPWIHNLATKRGLSLDQNGFKEILAPLKYVDWFGLHLMNNSGLKKGGEPPAKWFQKWIKQAILNGIQWPLDEVNSDDKDLVDHGRALLAKPSDPEINFVFGAVDVTLNLLWKNGNVFDKPGEIKLVRTGLPDEELEGDWSEITGAGPSMDHELDPWQFQLEIPVDRNLLDTDKNGIIDINDEWEIVVYATNHAFVPTRELKYTPFHITP